MPPALDKTLEKDHRIQISSPVLSRDVDSTKDMDTQSKPVGKNYTRLRFNLSSLTALDFSSVKSLLELTEMPLQSMFNSSASYKIDLQPSLGASLGSVSMDKSGPDCPSPNEDSTASKKDHQSLTKTLPCLLYFQKVSKPLSSERSSGNMTRNQGNALRPEWHVVSRRAMQEKVDAQRTRLASQLHTLTSRTNRAKRRLHAVLGENVLQTINKKLEEFKGKFSTIATKTEPDPRSPAHNRCANASGIHEEEGDFLPENFSQQASSTFSGPAVCQGGGTLSRTSAESVQLIRSVQSLVQCGQAVLCRAQQNLDSDVTESSSEDELDEESRRKRLSASCLGCEWTYRRERSKLASQWTWMKLRLSELDLQIQRVSHLHQHILSNKEGVVLAEAQPLTDLQIQQTLLTETAGLTLTAGQTHDLNSELDTEPSSPTRLLRNIERQSAQLSQIVNSLMSPLSDSPSHSPVAKRDSSCWGRSRKRPFSSTGTDAFPQNGCTRIGTTNRRKRQAARRSQLQSQMDATLACARTRPLLTHHKPRLFIADQTPVTQQGTDSSAYRYSNSTIKCNPINSTLKLNKNSVSHCVHTASFREDCLHRSRSIVLSHAVSTADKPTSSIFNCTHQLQAAQSHCKATQTLDALRKKRRRQRGPDIDAYVSQSGTSSPSAKDSTEEVLTPHHTTLHRRKSQFPTRRRSGESVYDVNNIVVPMSLAASTTVEKLQYKDIPTPSWRIVEFSPLKEVKEDINETESLSNEVFVQRHQSYECREKLSWSSCEQDRRYTLRNRPPHLSRRFSSSTDASSDCEPCSTSTDAPDNMEEREPQTPWERRTFPLAQTDEDTLKSEDKLCLNNQETSSSLRDSSWRNSVSSVCAHTPPPAGQTQNKKRTVTSRSHTDFFSPLSHRHRGLQSRM